MLTVLFIMLSLSIVMLADVFVENFTNPKQVNQQWLFFGSPQPEIGGPVYGKQSVFDNFGDGWCESGIYSKDWWDFSNGGSIEAEVYLNVTHVQGCWIDQIIGFTQGKHYETGDCANDGVIRTSLMQFYLLGHACWASEEESRGHAYISGYDITKQITDHLVNQWVKLRVEMNAQGKITLYVNDQLFGQSEKKMSLEERKNVRIFVGGRSSGYGGEVFVNYVKIQTSDKPDKVKLSGEFGITLDNYEDTANWNAIVEALFGSNYRVADWNDLVQYHAQGGDLLALFDSLGLTKYQACVFVTRNGNPRYSGDRYYYASRHEHNKPGNYLAHENIDRYLISLGSWWGSRPILAIRK